MTGFCIRRKGCHVYLICIPCVFRRCTRWNHRRSKGSLDDEQLQFARKHVRILSGMYGILKPSSGISPYRLERIVDLRILKQGKTGDYRYNENFSTENDWVFTRNST
ncbi:MAG: hypothetical protein DRP70_08505 [Spirochaetes bacterium]|nr:MAG: hypothetical protein DRP60_02770 [Spirochaetota bacterium]RKX87417.1 MAG: hypothetical protein DRP70_08505 [Spirochaetota bacterium]